MYDPKRISLILERIRTQWEAHPDQRLGQLLHNIRQRQGDWELNLFDVEDADWLRPTDPMCKWCLGHPHGIPIDGVLHCPKCCEIGCAG